jgi:hydrophobic/amphiphilic exporter-1 (mainly G- bacteria), HAE1 family
VVIIEFQLHIDGRKAAEDVREKVAAMRPRLRDEVKEPIVLRFDPASRAIWWSVAVTPARRRPTGATQRAPGARADQLGRPGAQEAARERARRGRGDLVGAYPARDQQVYLRPPAMEALGVTADQVVAARAHENQDLPLGAMRSRGPRAGGADRRPHEAARGFRADHRRAPRRPAGLPGQVARVVDGAQEIESLALYNGQRTLLLDIVQKAQDENTIAVVDGLKAACWPRCARSCRRACAWSRSRRRSRPIRVSVANVRRTLIEGAVLTVLIVFLFLNSWRSTVITGLTLPISLIGTFLVMYASASRST